MSINMTTRKPSDVDWLEATTFEEAAELTASFIAYHYEYEARPSVGMSRAVTNVSKMCTPDGAPDADSYLSLASSVLDRYSEASTADTLNKVVATVIAKQHDYGHGNILAWGHLGLAVRLTDKQMRLRNLEARQQQDPTSNPIHESIEDTWMDMLGYCIIGIMLHYEVFSLPLERDLEGDLYSDQGGPGSGDGIVMEMPLDANGQCHVLMGVGTNGHSYLLGVFSTAEEAHRISRKKLGDEPAWDFIDFAYGVPVTPNAGLHRG